MTQVTGMTADLGMFDVVPSRRGIFYRIRPSTVVLAAAATASAWGYLAILNGSAPPVPAVLAPAAEPAANPYGELATRAYAFRQSQTVAFFDPAWLSEPQASAPE